MTSTVQLGQKFRIVRPERGLETDYADGHLFKAHLEAPLTTALFFSFCVSVIFGGRSGSPIDTPRACKSVEGKNLAPRAGLSYGTRMEKFRPALLARTADY